MTKNPDFWRELEHSRALTDEEWRWIDLLVPASDGVPILFLLHMDQGYVQELEVLRADGGPLDVTIDLTGATFTLHD